MSSISIEEFEAHVRDVLARVAGGEVVVITGDRGELAKITPCEPQDWEKALGIRRATLPMSGWEPPRIELLGEVDSVALIRAERDERGRLS